MTRETQAVSDDIGNLSLFIAEKPRKAKFNIGSFVVLAAVLAVHAAICTFVNIFETAPASNPFAEAIPVELVTSLPPAPKASAAPAADDKGPVKSESPPKTEAKAPEKAEAKTPDKAPEQPQDKLQEKSEEKPEEKPSEKPPEKPQEKPQEKPPESPEQQPTQKAALPAPKAPEAVKPAAKQADAAKPVENAQRNLTPQLSDAAKMTPAPDAATKLPQSTPDPGASPIQMPPQFSMSPQDFRAMAVPQSSDNGDDVLPYQTLVFSRLELAKHYPEAAFARGSHGSSGIGFTLDKDGNVLDVELLVSSGDPDLDKESVDLVRRAAPFPVPPKGAQTRFDAVITFDRVVHH